MKTYFMIDFFCAIPISTILLNYFIRKNRKVNDILIETNSINESITNMYYERFVMSFEFLKFIRFFRVTKNLSRHSLVNPSLYQLLLMVAFVVYSWHLVACLYWFVEEGLDFETKMAPESHIITSSIANQYWHSIWWSAEV